MTTAEASAPVPFTRDDYLARMERVVKAAADEGLAGVMVTPGPDLVWLTGYQPTAITERLTMLVLTPDHSRRWSCRRSSGPTPRRPGRGQRPSSTGPTAPTRTDGRRARCSTRRPFRHLRRGLGHAPAGPAAALPDTATARCPTCLPMLRAVKDDNELARLRAAGAAADAAYGDILGVRFAGRRETEVAADLAALLRAVRPRAGGLHRGRLRSQRRQPTSRGRRAGHRGRRRGGPGLRRADGRLRLRHHADGVRRRAERRRSATCTRSCAQAQQAAFEAVRPGVACQDIDRAAPAVITDAGYGEQFIHRTGHGIGVTTHEPPYMVEGEEQPLVPGMCFSVEPGIYLPGRFGVRIEDIVTVTADGGRASQHTPTRAARRRITTRK